MAKGILVVFSNPTSPEQEAEYNDWYGNVHVHDVTRVPGFVAATRYKYAQTQLIPDGTPEYGYLAIYEVEGDLADAAKALTEAAGGGMQLNEALDMSKPPSAVFYEQLTDRVSRTS